MVNEQQSSVCSQSIIRNFASLPGGIQTPLQEEKIKTNITHHDQFFQQKNTTDHKIIYHKTPCTTNDNTQCQANKIIIINNLWWQILTINWILWQSRQKRKSQKLSPTYYIYKNKNLTRTLQGMIILCLKLNVQLRKPIYINTKFKQQNLNCRWGHTSR